MAKRKLSKSQRMTIRQDLSKLLSTVKTKAEAFRTVAKKYGITTITARWYAKTLKGAPAPAKAKAAKAAAPAPVAKKEAAKPRSTSAARNGHSPVTGALGKIVAGVRASAEKAFARARLAKRLLPQWQLAVRKEHILRKAEQEVRRELVAVSRKARTLHEKIKSLTS